MRPRYAAVDFAYCINGGLSKYGKSFLVLKDHMKHNSTFTHCDSFEVDMDLMGRKDEYFGTKLNLQDVTARLLPPADHRRDVVRPVFNDVVSDVS